MSSPLTVRGILETLTPADAVACAAVLGFSFVLAGAPGRSSEVPAEAVVRIGAHDVARLPLDRDGTYPVEGRLGPVVLEVAGGAVRVVESGCPQKICVSMGAKRHAGELLACVPNTLLVRLEGKPADEEIPDAIAR